MIKIWWEVTHNKLSCTWFLKLIWGVVRCFKDQTVRIDVNYLWIISFHDLDLKYDLMKTAIINSASSWRCSNSTIIFIAVVLGLPQICYLFSALLMMGFIFIKSWLRLKLMLPQINVSQGFIKCCFGCFLVDKIVFSVFVKICMVVAFCGLWNLFRFVLGRDLQVSRQSMLICQVVSW